MRNGERGQVLALVALSIVVLVGIAALAVDIGYLRFQQRSQQIATDSAALAGAYELQFTPASRITSGALRDAATNGYTDGANNVKVTVNYPPLSGRYAGMNTAVEVIITKRNLPIFFSGVLGAANPTVTTRAVGALSPTYIGCVYSLQGALTMHGGGGGGVNAPRCGVEVNGDLNVTGNANVDARFIGYTGKGPGGGTYPDGQPTKMAVPTADPCAKFPSCLYLSNFNPTSLPCADTGPINTSALPPGRYCKAINGNITFASFGNGLYVFDKPITTGNMTGTGVTIYNNSGTGIKWNGNTTVNVSAPAGGSNAGMVYYQPASNTGDITEGGKSNDINFQGGFYAPGSDVTINGDLPSLALFVAATITMNGGGMHVAPNPSLSITGHGVLAE